MNMTIDKIELPKELTLEDKWILSSLNKVIKEVTYNLEHFEMGVAAQKVYDFIWNSFCDWYIELAKNRFNGEDAQAKKNVENVLAYVLTDILKMLHPFMPFITEEIYQALPHEEGYLMMQSWPEYKAELDETIKKLKAKNKKLNEAVKELHKGLKEAYMTNVNLGKITKLFLESTTTQAEKLQIVERFSNEAKTPKQAQALYESISKELAKKTTVDESKVTEKAVVTESKAPVYKSQDLLNTIDLMNRVLNC
jgi:valyl-tRNA synthetase